MARNDYGNNVRWATRKAGQIQWEFDNGSDNWRAGLIEIWRAGMAGVPERELDEKIGARFASVFGAWKTTVCGTAWHSRPFHVAEIQGRPGHFRVWMNEVQREALASRMQQKGVTAT